jgi:hypothetical protein
MMREDERQSVKGEMSEKDAFPLFLLFLVPLFAAATLNLIFVVYPLVVEGMIIKDVPFGIIGLDAWVAHSLFGVPLSEAGFAYAVYIPFLIEVYLISFLPGFIIGLRLIWPPLKKLVRNHEITVSEKKFGARVVLDVIIAGYFGILALNPILAYLMQYPWEQVGFLPSSELAGYIMTGFVTGCSIAKLVFPLWLNFTCRKRGLRFVAVFVDPRDSKVKPWFNDRIVKWTLVTTGKQRQQ